MSSDQTVSRPDKFAQAANGDTAGSYFADGRYNIGGWSTYPSADERAISTAIPPLHLDRPDLRSARG
ncbi:MAG TPA: hypothetical protein VMA36_07650 [Candidatus Limnocylindria bacterium]|jgi:hypothetical protein|nr:hypothetical protein [Candidatus Limnocylindria bacterium]